MTDEAEVTVTNWKTKLSNAWSKFYAWAKLHPGIVIPSVTYLAGVATPTVVRWLVT